MPGNFKWFIENKKKTNKTSPVRYLTNYEVCMEINHTSDYT